MTISDWPSMERPREKLLAQGPRALSSAELLALFIQTGTRGCSAVDVARNALVHAGGLRALFDLPPDRLADIPGIGPARAALIKAAIEIATRYLEEGLQKREIFSCPEDTCHYLHARLRSRPHEVFACLFMDNRHRMIAYEEMFRGTINGTSVHPREIVKRALELNAAALIVAHNHPSGVAEPSETDRSMTRKLASALALVDLRLLDHIVIGDGDVVSFSQRGLL
ncbi:RadC family protein [Thioalkalivibrio sp. HK1]|uniref:RadC family protein n=1 Tax=Thioalkalivibrio sp. HK1 TaxID=1469245 RepID=UPI00046E60AA|nr:DNA repair protein RadC [Thioalkalivibrio sp. HK1]